MSKKDKKDTFINKKIIWIIFWLSLTLLRDACKIRRSDTVREGGSIMNTGKSHEYKQPQIFSNNDPLGIRKVVLGGRPPSLHLEAKIAYKQWVNHNGNGKVSADGSKPS